MVCRQVNCVPFNDLSRIHLPLNKEITDFFQHSMLNSSFIGGNEVINFEKSFCDYTDHRFCISCANGTDALQIALYALKLEPGSEVVVPAHTWVSTAEAVIEQGLTPVFCDTDSNFLIDSRYLSSLLTDKTRALIAVHLAGNACYMQQIKEFCDIHGLFLIEDCAQAHGTKLLDIHVGNYSDIATFSFYPGKNLGAFGDAGAIVTNNSSLADLCRSYANHGGKGIHKISGINSRLDSLQAGILNIKLPYLEGWIAKKQVIADIYCQELKSVGNWVDLPSTYNDLNIRHTYHLFMIRAQKRDDLKKYLSECGIGTLVNYRQSLNTLPAFADFYTPCPVSEKNATEILSLPIFPGMSSEESLYVCDKIKEFYLGKT